MPFDPTLFTPWKDAATVASVIVAIFSLIVSLTVGTVSVRAARRRSLLDKQDIMGSALSGLLDARTEREKIRSQDPDKFMSDSMRRTRQALNNVIDIAVARCVQAATEKSLNLSAPDCALIASALIDSGRIGLAVEFYKRALASANDEFEIQRSRRVYGRALIASGNLDEGRREMIAAATGFEQLSSNPIYDRDVMLEDAAEAYRRLVEIQLITRNIDFVHEDAVSGLRLASQIRDSSRRVHVERFSREIYNPTPTPESN